MRSFTRTGGVWLAALCLLMLPAAVIADPGEDHGHDGIEVPPPSLPGTPPGSANAELLDVADKDGTINSDLAFHKNLAFAGNYDGFRIIDIRRPSDLRLLSDTRCRANQGDLSVFKARDGRLILLQSLDRAVTAPDCTGGDTATTTEDELGTQVTRARFGYEGLRMFDVTNPANPKFLRFYRTECGSHTHTLVPDPKNGRIHAYVASYPLGSQITPQIDRAQSDPLGLTCDPPHSKISVVSIPLSDPEAGVVHKRALSSDTEPYEPDGPFDPETGEGHAAPFVSCHDHQAFLARNIMVASCAGDAQYWDISKRGDPSSADGEAHTHIQREVREDDPHTPEDERVASFDFIHNATVSWDGQTTAIVDESGGGVQARCDGENSLRGFTFIYPLVEPGTPVDGFADLQGTYMIDDRPQNAEICVSHNGNVLPTDDGRFLQVQAFYSGGNTLVDFTDPAHPAELAFADLETSLGAADSWSTYWYNDVMWVNGGLNRRGATANRGFEAYALYDENGDRIETRNWRMSNPQTQEAWQAP